MNDKVAERLKELIVLKMIDQLSAEQKEELNELSKIPGAINFIERYEKDYLLHELQIFQKLDEKRPQAWQNIRPFIDFRKKVLTVWQRMAIAASFAIIISVCAYLYFSSGSDEPPAVAQQTGPYQQEIMPATGVAVLTLADGRQINLQENGTAAVLANEEGAVIKATGDQGLVYEQGKAAAKEVHNMISTPKGVMYSITLSDGTRCWLNTSSSLKYPASFVGKERRVTVTGEVYFEVAKDKARPFIVTADNSEITVMGTHFNVNAYADEPAVSTTLLEGKVQVSGYGKQNVLMPGQQARAIKEAGSLQLLKKVDLDEVMGWKQDKFVFQGDGMAIQDIMKQLQRYYDIEVVYEGVIPDDKFITTMPRSLPISRILQVIQKTQMIRFRIEDRKVIVMPWK